MKRKWDLSEEQYFGIGIYRPKTAENLGTLWRSALVYGASFVFVIEAKYKKKSSDVLKVWSKIPLFQYKTLEAFLDSVPYSCQLIGIEIDVQAQAIKNFEHPARAIYILGAEDNGLPKELKNRCHELVFLPGETSLNVSVAGSITIFDRINKLS